MVRRERPGRADGGAASANGGTGGTELPRVLHGALRPVGAGAVPALGERQRGRGPSAGGDGAGVRTVATGGGDVLAGGLPVPNRAEPAPEPPAQGGHAAEA